MGKLKGAGEPSSPPRVSSELSYLEFELQIHHDETNTRLDEMQASLQDSLAISLESFRSMLVDDFKAQLTALKEPPIVNQGSTAVPLPDGTVHFGSLPSPPVVSAIEDTSSTMARFEVFY